MGQKMFLCSEQKNVKNPDPVDTKRYNVQITLNGRDECLMKRENNAMYQLENPSRIKGRQYLLIKEFQKI